jgi:hypothetical protein
VTFAVWSTPDRQEVHRAIDFTKQFAGEFTLGVRPYDYREECEAWIPPSLGQVAGGGEVEIEAVRSPRGCEVAIHGRTDTPIWVGIRDGVVQSVRAGKLTEAELREIASSITSKLLP